MNKEFYDKVSTVVPMSGVIDEYMASYEKKEEYLCFIKSKMFLLCLNTN